MSATDRGYGAAMPAGSKEREVEMADEGRRQEDGTAAETSADNAAAQSVAEAMDGESAACEATAGPSERAVREDALPDSEGEASETPPGVGPSDEPSGGVEGELADARQAAKENLDRALRAQADLENVRRRMTRDVENAHKFALERFVSELLPVKDSLELGLAASTEDGAGVTSIVEGLELTLRMLEQVMDKFGVKILDPVGEPFNPEFHQAITMQESDTAESGTVLTVVQKGCLLNERLVRPAMVIVAK